MQRQFTGVRLDSMDGDTAITRAAASPASPPSGKVGGTAKNTEEPAFDPGGAAVAPAGTLSTDCSSSGGGSGGFEERGEDDAAVAAAVVVVPPSPETPRGTAAADGGLGPLAPPASRGRALRSGSPESRALSLCVGHSSSQLLSPDMEEKECKVGMGDRRHRHRHRDQRDHPQSPSPSHVTASSLSRSLSQTTEEGDATIATGVTPGDDDIAAKRRRDRRNLRKKIKKRDRTIEELRATQSMLLERIAKVQAQSDVSRRNCSRLSNAFESVIWKLVVKEEERFRALEGDKERLEAELARRDRRIEELTRGAANGKEPAYDDDGSLPSLTLAHLTGEEAPAEEAPAEEEPTGEGATANGREPSAAAAGAGWGSGSGAAASFFREALARRHEEMPSGAEDGGGGGNRRRGCGGDGGDGAFFPSSSWSSSPSPSPSPSARASRIRIEERLCWIGCSEDDYDDDDGAAAPRDAAAAGNLCGGDSEAEAALLHRKYGSFIMELQTAYLDECGKLQAKLAAKERELKLIIRSEEPPSRRMSAEDHEAHMSRLAKDHDELVSELIESKKRIVKELTLQATNKDKTIEELMAANVAQAAAISEARESAAAADRAREDEIAAREEEITALHERYGALISDLQSAQEAEATKLRRALGDIRREAEVRRLTTAKEAPEESAAISCHCAHDIRPEGNDDVLTALK